MNFSNGVRAGSSSFRRKAGLSVPSERTGVITQRRDSEGRATHFGAAAFDLKEEEGCTCRQAAWGLGRRAQPGVVTSNPLEGAASVLGAACANRLVHRPAYLPSGFALAAAFLLLARSLLLASSRSAIGGVPSGFVCFVGYEVLFRCRTAVCSQGVAALAQTMAAAAARQR